MIGIILWRGHYAGDTRWWGLQVGKLMIGVNASESAFGIGAWWVHRPMLRCPSLAALMNAVVRHVEGCKP